MWYDYRFRAYPDRTGVTAEAERHIDIHRQAYNHTRYEYQSFDTDEDNIGSAYQHQKRLTEWKDEWPVFSDVHSKALQKTVERFYDNLSNLSEKKQNGHNVGWLKWKSPREYQSVTYSQSGFELQKHEWSDCHALDLKSVTSPFAITAPFPTTPASKKSR